MLEPGSLLRRVWIVGAAALLVLYGAASAATTLSLTSLRNTLAYHEDFHKGLARRAAQPGGRRASCGAARCCRCPTTS